MGYLLVSCLLLQAVLCARAQYNYAEVLQKSILFYEAQRSGDLPSSNRIPWRGDSAMGDGSDVGLDLTGGWYDAGDHVKFGFPLAWSVTTLAWGILEFESAYQSTGEMTNALDSIRWPLDYLIKCHVSDNEFYGQVADADDDHAYWGRPEEMTMARPSWKIDTSAPGSDLAAETAAAMAASSMVFQATDPSYASTLLSHARTLYDFAYNNRGFYHDAIPDTLYDSTNYNDELGWGAIWLYRATGESQYLTWANEFYNAGTGWAYSWDSKEIGLQLMLYITTNDPQYSSVVETYLRSYMPGGSIPYTPLGLVYRNEWGALRYAANAAFIAMVSAKYNIIPSEAKPWAESQIHYMLGDTGRSYVLGFGNNPPTQPHHRAASCPDLPATCDQTQLESPDPNPQVINGALVGGPDINDYFVDDRNDYTKLEVATDYNAGFQGAIAALIVG